MSYNFDGKIVNQCPKQVNLTSRKTVCEKCRKILNFPEEKSITFSENSYVTYNYLNTDHYIYETKIGRSVAYCSNYCKQKHNHRFKKG